MCLSEEQIPCAISFPRIYGSRSLKKVIGSLPPSIHADQSSTITRVIVEECIIFLATPRTTPTPIASCFRLAQFSHDLLYAAWRGSVRLRGRVPARQTWE